MRKENVDVVGDKPVKNDAGEMSKSEEAKQSVWAEHYERLLNIEFDRDSSPVQQTAVRRPAYTNHFWRGQDSLLKDEVGQSCRSIRHSGEMIKAEGDTGATMIGHLAATGIICDGKVPTDWEQFHCLPLQGQG